MFAIRKVLQKGVSTISVKPLSSISVYDIQDFTMQEQSNNKEIISNVFHSSLLIKDNVVNECDNYDLNKTEDELIQQECMYHLAKP